MDAQFTIKGLSPTKIFVGLQIAHSSSRMYLSQCKYIQDIMKDAKLIEAKPVATPLPRGTKLRSDDHSPLLTDPE